MRQSRSHSAGFTLIELILVLLVLTIMVGMAAPSLRGFGIGRRSAQVATQLVSLAQFARMQAASEGKVFRLSFDLPNRAFAVQVSNAGVFSAASNEYGESVTLPDGMSMQAELPQRQDGTYVEFRPDGRCDPARIFLTDSLGGVIEVACPSATELFHIIKAGEVDQ